MNLAIPIGYLKFSRDAEREADYLGLQYMYKAGYDPNAFVSFFEKIEAEERRHPGSIPKVFSTHPPTPDRVQKAQEEIATILPARDEYIVTTSEFDLVKSRLRGIENKNKLDDKKTAATSPPCAREPRAASGEHHRHAAAADQRPAATIPIRIAQCSRSAPTTAAAQTKDS